MATQIDISRYRKNPRPKYYNASTGSFVEIGFDMETWLLRMSGIAKRMLIARLQKCLTTAQVQGARDNLHAVALRNQAANAGAAITELDGNLGEFQVFMQNEVASSSGIPEVGMMLNDIGTSYGESLFARDQQNNVLVAANVMTSRLSNSGTRRQVQSWVEIITQYVIPG